MDGSGELARGAGLVLYTDGLVEERSRDISDGMDASARGGAGRPAPTIRRSSPTGLLSQLVGESRGDDVALLVLRRD